MNLALRAGSEWWGAWTVAGKCRRGQVKAQRCVEHDWQSQVLAVVVATVAVVAAVVAPPHWCTGHLFAMPVVKN